MALNIVKTFKEQKGTKVYHWTRPYDTFSVQVMCMDRKASFPEGMRYGWCLYLVVTKDNPLFKYVSVENDDDCYACTSELVLEHMHGGVTFREVTAESVQIGCDFSHYIDRKYQTTPPEDESCMVHLYADSLESFVLEASGKEPTLKPEDWVKLATTNWELKDLYASLLKGEHPFKPNVLFL